MAINLLTASVFLTFTLPPLAFIIYRRYHNLSLSKIPGPEPESFILGNLCELFQSEAGEADFKWQDRFGGVVRVKAAFGENRLIISDPKALQYIYHIAGYHFQKQDELRGIAYLVSGPGILWADGDVHKRHKKIMLPGFGAPESRAFLPIFLATARQVTTQWKDVIGNTAEQSAVLNIPSFIHRAMLDVIGEAAFDYNFGAMERADNPLAVAYDSMLADIFGSPTDDDLITQSILSYIPNWLMKYLLDHLPSEKLERARSTGRLATEVARELVASKSVQGDSKRDIMSILVKANLAESENKRLGEEELFAQMRTIMLAGHETTSSTMSWAILELAKNPDIQAKLREEIWATEKVISDRGDSDFSLKDLESMPYMVAVLKEVLRLYPVAYHNHRQAVDDQVVPLSKPIMTTTGKVLHELFVPKGTKVIMSIIAYNRDRDIWGEDAHTFNPDRWLGVAAEKSGPTTGMYGNLLTFSGGIRSCIGWRFAVIELQAFLVEMVGNFKFEPTEDINNIRREACFVMVPTLKGQERVGSQMPIRVSVASRD